MNISNYSGITDSHIVIKALDITCDLHRASTELIPSIQDVSSTAIVNALASLSNASLRDSCAWLKDEVKMVNSHATVACGSLSDICTMRNNNKEYGDAFDKVRAFDSGISRLDTRNYTGIFSATVQTEILQILSM